jgi:uncharacterized Ntn-hydrolase superfamily protein
MTVCASDETVAAARESPIVRPVATYSIVARDADTGEMGVAVQSHWFSVGSVVPWAEAGVGAVATQSMVEVSYGPLGLELMRGGRTAIQALAALTSTDEGEALRQVAMIDANGNVSTHTGGRCIAEAGHQNGTASDGSVFSCQANLMARKTVPGAMAQAFENAPAGTPLAERMMLALHAAQNDAGDIRGKQSCAILVVRAHSTGVPWKDRLVDLRVEDAPDPLAEMDRLLKLQRAYDHMNAGDVAMELGDIQGALKEYSAARQLAPGNAEMGFWTAVSLINAGQIKQAEPILRECYKDTKGDWRETLRRLPQSGLLDADAETVTRLSELKAAP